MPLLNTSSLISNISGAASKIGAITQNFDPSSARLAAANLIKGGAVSSITSAVSSIGGSIGGAIGGPFGGMIGNSISKSISGAITGSLGNAMSGAAGPMNALASGSGILSGIMQTGIPGTPTIAFGTSKSTQNTNGAVPNDDWRIRIRCPALNVPAVVFPILPAITFSYAANYSKQNLTHSNYASYFYESSEVREIQIVGDFPIQNEAEGNVLLNTINFFKATTKMYFGASTNSGNPPPIVFLNGYGKPFMSEVPCVIIGFQHTMPDNVDYIKCFNVRLPTFSQLTVTLQPVISRATAGQFDHSAYAMGLQRGFM